MRTLLAVVLMSIVWGRSATAVSSEPLCMVPPAVEQEGPSLHEVAGHYMAVSESEWNLEVWLNRNGTAKIQSEAWEAGHHDSRTTSTYRGKWSLSGEFVELRYAGRCETLRFDPALSFAEFGTQGSAAGLQGQHSSEPANLFVGTSLWNAQSLRRIPEVK